jgi:hypothetical protein
MAALSDYLISKSIEKPGLKIVTRPNATQATELQKIGIRPLKVDIRKRERRPSRVLLGTLNHCDFRVIKPIPVHLDVRGNTVIASWRQVDEFGVGKSMSLACDDLGHTIVELYASLKTEEAHLGPDLAKVWSVLKEHVVRRPDESA